MRPSLVVVLDPFPHHSLQVTAPDDQHPIQAFSAPRADLPLHVCVRPRGRDRGLDDPHAFGLEHSVRRTGELGVVVVDHEADLDTSSCQTRFRLC